MASPVINDIVKVSWIATILPLLIVLSYPPTSITVGQVSVTTAGLSDQFPTMPLIHAQAKKKLCTTAGGRGTL
jgi:hypothetical protein